MEAAWARSFLHAMMHAGQLQVKVRPRPSAVSGGREGGVCASRSPDLVGREKKTTAIAAFVDCTPFQISRKTWNVFKQPPLAPAKESCGVLLRSLRPTVSISGRRDHASTRPRKRLAKARRW